MLRAFDCSDFMPSPPRTFSDSVGFTPVLRLYEQFTSVSALSPRMCEVARIIGLPHPMHKIRRRHNRVCRVCGSSRHDSVHWVQLEKSEKSGRWVGRVDTA